MDGDICINTSPFSDGGGHRGALPGSRLAMPFVLRQFCDVLLGYFDLDLERPIVPEERFIGLGCRAHLWRTAGKVAPDKQNNNRSEKDKR